MNGGRIALVTMIAVGWTSAGWSSPYDDLDRLIPRAEMSEAVFKTLAAALDSFQPEKGSTRHENPFTQPDGGSTPPGNPFGPAAAADEGFTPDVKKRNAAALAQLRRVPWPDLKRLEFKRFSLTERNGRDRTAWLMPSKKWSDYLILPASFEALSLRESDVSKAVATNYLDGLAALLAAKNDPAGLGRMVLGIDDEGTWATTELLLFHDAYAAAYFGKQEEAQRLLHRALRQNPTCIVDAYEEWAWRSFLRGICLLADGAMHEEVVTQWKETRRLYGESSYGAQVNDLLAELEKQLVEDYELDETATPTPDRLRVERRIPYFLARLPKMHENAFNTSGWWYDFEMFATRQAPLVSDRLVEIGRPAVPGLIEHLMDRRVTRLVHSRDCFEHRAIPLRAQDVALACIEKILKMTFYQPSVDGRQEIVLNGKPAVRLTMAHFSMEPESKRQEVIGKIKKWWETYGQRPAAEGLMARLDQVPVAQRMDMLREIEASDKKPLPGAVALMKRWSGTDVPERLWIYADELARRGNRSLVPALRGRLGEAWAADRGQCVAVLIAHGDAADYRWLRQACREDMGHGLSFHGSRIWGFVYEQIHDSRKVLAVPILVDLLDAREIIKVRWIEGPNGTKGLSPAEACLTTLAHLTGHEEAARPGVPAEDRFARVDRWVAWWRKEGAVAFLKAHPEVRPIMEDSR